jgi:hypothetical protein
MTRIVTGMSLYMANDRTLQTAIRQALELSDQVVIVYGRWKCFDVPWIEPPSFLFDGSFDPDRLKVILSDHERKEEQSRNLYLKGLEEGDVLVQWDPDMTLININGIGGLRTRLLDEAKADRWDALLVPLLVPETWETDQETILIYRYRQGWQPIHAGALGDPEGQLIASPRYRIERAEWFSFLHHRDQGSQYRKALQEYYDQMHRG